MLTWLRERMAQAQRSVEASPQTRQSDAVYQLSPDEDKRGRLFVDALISAGMRIEPLATTDQIATLAGTIAVHERIILPSAAQYEELEAFRGSLSRLFLSLSTESWAYDYPVESVFANAGVLWTTFEGRRPSEFVVDLVDLFCGDLRLDDCRDTPPNTPFGVEFAIGGKQFLVEVEPVKRPDLTGIYKAVAQAAVGISEKRLFVSEESLNSDGFVCVYVTQGECHTLQSLIGPLLPLSALYEVQHK